jgi:hypothetical protein
MNAVTRARQHLFSLPRGGIANVVRCRLYLIDQKYHKSRWISRDDSSKKITMLKAPLVYNLDRVFIQTTRCIKVVPSRWLYLRDDAPEPVNRRPETPPSSLPARMTVRIFARSKPLATRPEQTRRYTPSAWHSRTTATTAHPAQLRRLAFTHRAADLHLRCARRPEALITPELLTRGHLCTRAAATASPGLHHRAAAKLPPPPACNAPLRCRRQRPPCTSMRCRAPASASRWPPRRAPASREPPASTLRASLREPPRARSLAAPSPPAAVPHAHRHPPRPTPTKLRRATRPWGPCAVPPRRPSTPPADLPRRRLPRRPPGFRRPARATAREGGRQPRREEI